MAPFAKLALVLTLTVGSLPILAAPSAPNIVLLFADDLGYGDLGCYGAADYETPSLDRLAREGARFTDFYVSSPVCSASRAALLTGCYHERVGISGALGPGSRIGLNPEETTLAEISRSRGLATAAIGKWHLGRPEAFLPLQHGFDEFFGLPYSNDMWPHHPSVRHLSREERIKRWPALPLIEGNRVIDEEITAEDQRMLTRSYTSRAVEFIHRHRDKPFFLYLAFSMPHVPLFVSAEAEGKSGAGLYGDVIREIDDSVGRILTTLSEEGLDEHTAIFFTSDNGPWLSYGEHAGSAGGLREGKGTCWEGGVRVPFLARWPGKIPAGIVVHEPAMTIDLLPTVAGLLHADLPSRRLDGKDIWPLLAGEPGAKSPHDALFFYYQSNELQAMRAGNWKLILPHRYRSFSGKIGRDDGIPVDYDQAETGLELYDLSVDPGEKVDVAKEHPEVMEELIGSVEMMRQDLGDRLTSRKGMGNRSAGVLPDSE